MCMGGGGGEVYGGEDMSVWVVVPNVMFVTP